MIRSLFSRKGKESGGDKPALANLFSKVSEARKSGKMADIDGVDRVKVSAAVLMVEVAQLDTEYSKTEIDRICNIMQREFGMTFEEANSLLDTAEHRHEEAYTNWLFTKTIKEKVGLDERTHVMEHLWDIAYADGELHELEADLLLRIGQAIGLPEKHRIDALERVFAKRIPQMAR